MKGRDGKTGTEGEGQRERGRDSYTERDREKHTEKEGRRETDTQINP